MCRKCRGEPQWLFFRGTPPNTPGEKRDAMFGLPVRALSGIIIVTLKKMLYMNHNKCNGGNMKRAIASFFILLSVLMFFTGCVTRPGNSESIILHFHHHSGIDIDGYGNEGGIIIAADGGTVITATYSDGYGNYIIIDHGNGYKTLYGHMSGMAVSSGQSVSQGQTIGYLGSTGRATGTHCHFEIFINGNRTDPAAYFSGLSYYNC